MTITGEQFVFLVTCYWFGKITRGFFDWRLESQKVNANLQEKVLESKDKRAQVLLKLKEGEGDELRRLSC